MVQAQHNAVAQKLMESFMRFRRLNWRQNSVTGLTAGELMVLNVIRAGTLTNRKGIRVSDIGAHLSVASPTITQQVNNLVTHGYVQRNIDSEDRRAVRITITEKGEKALNEHSKAFFSTINDLVVFLGEEDSIVLADLLGKVFDHYQRLEIRD